MSFLLNEADIVYILELYLYIDSQLEAILLFMFT